MDVLDPGGLTDAEDELFGYLMGSWAPERAVTAVEEGETPDLAALEKIAAALDLLRQGILAGRLIGSMDPTEEDVAAARRLVELVRAGASKENLAAVAQRVQQALRRRASRRKSP